MLKIPWFGHQGPILYTWSISVALQPGWSFCFSIIKMNVKGISLMEQSLDKIQMKKMKVNIAININEFLRRKWGSKTQVWAVWEKMCKVWVWSSDHNALAWYGQKNNIVLSRILVPVSDSRLGVLVLQVLADIYAYADGSNIDSFCWFSQPDKQKSHKTIVCFVHRQNCKKLLIKKNLLLLIAINISLCKK